MLVSFILLLSPPPYFVIKPGEINSTKAFIQDNNEHANGKREDFYYTTVLLSDASWYEIAKASLQPHQALVSKKQLLSGYSLETFIARTELTMKLSQRIALEAAYKYLNMAYNKEAVELYVSTLNDKGSLFNDADRIKAIVINNEEIAITHVNQLLNIINNGSAFDAESYTLVVETKGKRRSIKMEHPAITQLPLTVEQLASEYKLSTFVELEEVIANDISKRLSIVDQQVGGPSAGLIMALSFIDILQHDVIESPYKIAATGSIQADGQVGIIGSIEQKVVAVDEASITIFLVPKEQEAIARKKAKSIDSAVNIIGVSTLSEAINAINQFKLE